MQDKREIFTAWLHGNKDMGEALTLFMERYNDERKGEAVIAWCHQNKCVSPAPYSPRTRLRTIT
eukprot:25582-Prorocentrum_lima.AAC.1